MNYTLFYIILHRFTSLSKHFLDLFIPKFSSKLWKNIFLSEIRWNDVHRRTLFTGILFHKWVLIFSTASSVKKTFYASKMTRIERNLNTLWPILTNITHKWVLNCCLKWTVGALWNENALNYHHYSTNSPFKDLRLNLKPNRGIFFLHKYLLKHAWQHIFTFFCVWVCEVSQQKPNYTLARDDTFYVLNLPFYFYAGL